jgi:toxin-antitoxin system PIN domain toxin
MHLPDINVWLALAFDSHQHHVRAVDWFRKAEPESCCFCRMTQQGFLRLSTTPRLMTPQALTLQDAWVAYDDLYHDPRVVFADEPEGIEALWRAHTQHGTFSPKVWNDAYLAAFAQSGDLTVVTFDKGFSQYAGASCLILS